MKINKCRYLTGLILIVCVCVISGCTAHSLYSVDMRYDNAGAVVPEYLHNDSKAPGKTIAVAEFTDTRQMDDRLVIGRVVEKNGMKILVFPKYKKATQAIAQGIKEYFGKAGYKVTSKIQKWDLNEENMPKIDSKMLVGGSIDELEVTCRRGFPTNSYRAKIKITIVIADPTSGKIIYQRTAESVNSLEHLFFSEERLGYQASMALSDSIEKVFEEKKVAQKIVEVMSAQ